MFFKIFFQVVVPGTTDGQMGYLYFWGGQFFCTNVVKKLVKDRKSVIIDVYF